MEEDKNSYKALVKKNQKEINIIKKVNTKKVRNKYSKTEIFFKLLMLYFVILIFLYIYGALMGGNLTFNSLFMILRMIIFSNYN